MVDWIDKGVESELDILNEFLSQDLMVFIFSSDAFANVNHSNKSLSVSAFHGNQGELRPAGRFFLGC